MNVNKNSSLLGRYSTKEDIIFKNQNDEGTLLLLEKPKENTQILKDIGFDYYINQVEAEVHIKNSKAVIGELFGKPSFLGSEIKKLCNDYDLVISRVQNYNGVPFKDLPEIIQSFIDANSYDVEVSPAKYTSQKNMLYHSNHKPVLDPITKEHLFEWVEVEIEPAITKKKSKIKTGYSNWFIMAPREAFDGNKKNTCCTLFYRDDDNSRNISEKDVFSEIYSWGGAYSDIRKYNYFLKHIDWNKESNKRNNVSFPETESSHDQISVILHLFILITMSFIMYFINFIALVITIIVILSSLYISIRKPCKNYYKLWKI